MKEGRVLEVEGTASAKLLKYENECCLLVDTWRNSDGHMEQMLTQNKLY